MESVEEVLILIHALHSQLYLGRTWLTAIKAYLLLETEMKDVQDVLHCESNQAVEDHPGLDSWATKESFLDVMWKLKGLALITTHE